jgi:bifunctional non-homologous end joining protein LigD
VVDSPASLAWLAADGMVELHPWGSRVVDVERPTWAVVGVDPGGGRTTSDMVVVVRLVRTALDHLGLEGRPVATGTGGLEVWVPIRPGPTFRQVRTWARSLARAVAATLPELVAPVEPGASSGIAGEDGGVARVRLDHTRNAVDAAPAAPFSVRAAAGAPVVVPLAWDDLDDPDLRADRWTVRTAGARLAAAGDPLAELVGRARDLPPI